MKTSFGNLGRKGVSQSMMFSSGPLLFLILCRKSMKTLFGNIRRKGTSWWMMFFGRRISISRFRQSFVRFVGISDYVSKINEDSVRYYRKKGGESMIFLGRRIEISRYWQSFVRFVVISDFISVSKLNEDSVRKYGKNGSEPMIFFGRRFCLHKKISTPKSNR